MGENAARPLELGGLSEEKEKTKMFLRCTPGELATAASFHCYMHYKF